DEWGVDVTVSGSQKGLMMPAGLSFNAVSARAMERHRTATLPRSYWDWSQMAQFNDDGFFPYTPATNLLYGLAEALSMLEEEGIDRVFARHARFAEATRRAAKVWGLANVAAIEAESSNSVTALFAPDGVDANELRRVILERFDMSLGSGLGDLAGRAFRIGHLGDLNDLTLIGTLGGVEMGLELAGVPYTAGGAQAAMDFMTETLQ
ncbi:MAG: pyridoxal-phosphate-dependent aminotransferase family protein, partial [Longimicrobiales bacterium]